MMKYWNQTEKLFFMIHIGKIIRSEVERQRLSQKEFGALIHKSVATVQDIYGRATISTDLLITISAVLKKDILKFFYEEEPFNGLRDDETTKLRFELQKVIEQKEQLQKELAENRRLSEAQNELIGIYKMQLIGATDEGTKADI